MLKPEKWKASFDSDGKVLAFRKALRSIILGVCTFLELFNLHKHAACFLPFEYNMFFYKITPSM